MALPAATSRCSMTCTWRSTGPQRLRHPAQLHVQRHRPGAEDVRAQFELGVPRAEWAAVLADERQRRPGSERNPGRAAAGRPVQRQPGQQRDDLTVNNYKAERNGAYGPGFMSLDMRFGYRIPLKQHRRLELSVDVFNLTNHVNFANPSGNQASTTFLILNRTTRATRRAKRRSGTVRVLEHWYALVPTGTSGPRNLHAWSTSWLK